jgi:hypothetical protein
MSTGGTDYNRRAVRPLVCLQEGWQLIKDDYWLFFGITVVGMLIGGAVPFFLMLGPMWCGIDIAMLRRMDGRYVKFSTLFDGIEFFAPSLVASLILLGLNILVIVPIAVAYVVAVISFILPDLMQGGPPDVAIFAKFLVIIFLYVFALTAASVGLLAPNIFMYALIVERGLSGPAAFLTSVKAIFANFWGVVGLLFVYMVLHTLGALVIVGAWFVLPVLFATFAVAYRRVFPRPTLDYEFADEAEAEEPVDPVVAREPPSTAVQPESARRPDPETGVAPGPPD